MRRNIDLSTDAVAVILFISRQRLRLYQNVAFSEVQSALNYSGGRLHEACSERIRGGWLVVDEPRNGEPLYSLMAAGRKRVAKLVPRLN